MSHDIALFGLKPLLSAQEVDDYDALLAGITESLYPDDVIEEMWVRDLTDNLYEVHRLRRAKEALIHSALPKAMIGLLSSIHGAQKAEELVKYWCTGSQAAGTEIRELLKSMHLTEDAVRAHAIVEQMDNLERFDKLIHNAERRRRAYYKDLEQHRDSRTERVHKAAEYKRKNLDLKVNNKIDSGEAA